MDFVINRLIFGITLSFCFKVPSKIYLDISLVLNAKNMQEFSEKHFILASNKYSHQEKSQKRMESF